MIKKLVFGIVALLLILLGGYLSLTGIMLGNSFSYENAQITTSSYSDQVNTYVVGEEPRKIDGLTIAEIEKKGIRQDNIFNGQIDEEIDDCIKEITKNWKRVIDRKVVYGYDEEEDIDLRFELEQKALNGEKIC